MEASNTRAVPDMSAVKCREEISEEYFINELGSKKRGQNESKTYARVSSYLFDHLLHKSNDVNDFLALLVVCVETVVIELRKPIFALARSDSMCRPFRLSNTWAQK